MRFLIAVLLAAHSLFAQRLSLPSCDDPVSLRQILQQQLATEKLAAMHFPARVVFQRQLLENLITQYPRAVTPYRQIIQSTKEDSPDRYPELISQFQQEANLHPDDPLALYVAGLALSGTNTPLSIYFLEQSRSLNLAFPWPALELARIYAPGTKRADAAKASSEIAAFFDSCPSSADPVAQSQLARSGTKALQLRAASALRARLAGESNIAMLKEYATLWSLEFRVHSPTDYPALRTQVSADLSRLAGLNPRPDVEWLVFLKDGIKLSGASAGAVAIAEDRIIQNYPHSGEANEIARERWERTHKEPGSDGDATAWAAYHRAYRAVLKTWLGQFTAAPELQHAEAFQATLYDPDMPEQDGRRAVDDYLTYIAEYRRPNVNDILSAAWVLVDHNWEPSRVFTLLHDSDKLIQDWSRQMLGDNLSAETESTLINNRVMLQQAVASRILVAARLAEQPEQAERIRPFVERDLPPNSWSNIEARYWLDRGRLALLDDRKLEALTYYQKALALHKPPDAIEGRIIDDMLDEARLVWQKTGESKPPAAALHDSAAAGWQIPAKTMPTFELTDLSGKIWRLKDLSGRVVLINIWATWCGPCQRELPHIQNLYSKLKDRADVQILTLSIDTDPGILPAFLSAKGYTFPVLPADSFVTQLLDMVAVPQSWIIDPNGHWRWTGAPDTTDADWEAAMLRQLESVKK